MIVSVKLCDLMLALTPGCFSAFCPVAAWKSFSAHGQWSAGMEKNPLYACHFIKAIFLYSYIEFFYPFILRCWLILKANTWQVTPQSDIYLTCCASTFLLKILTWPSLPSSTQISECFCTCLYCTLFLSIWFSLTSSGFQKESHLEGQKSCIFGPHVLKQLGIKKMMVPT